MALNPYSHAQSSFISEKPSGDAVKPILPIPVTIPTLQTQLNHWNSSSLPSDTSRGYNDPTRFVASWLPLRNESSHLDVNSKEVTAFMSQNYLDNSAKTNFLSQTLKDNQAIVGEAQRLLLSLLKDILGSAKHVMFFEIATYENKGDPAISVGETLLLRKLNVTVVYYCDGRHCTQKNVNRAQRLSTKYPPGDLVILMQGGGNLVGYHAVDKIRERILNAFPDRTKVLFSQSIWLHGNNTNDLIDSRKIYSNRTNFIMFLRDEQTLRIAKENFKGIKHVLAPDMAFGIGMLPRQMPPGMYE